MNSLDLNFIIQQNLQRMMAHNLNSFIIDDFIQKLKKVYNGETGLVDFKNVTELKSEDILDLKELPFQLDYDSKITQEIAKKVALIQLNGGLGTSMGLQKAKTLLKIKDSYTFLDIILKQLHYLREKTQTPVPLLFMNSFNTSQDTLAYPGIQHLNQSMGLPEEFLQNKIPRISKDTLLPIGDGQHLQDWCPPGHGDVFLVLYSSGILDSLLEKGIEYVFLSNGDNLGAIFEPSILAYMIEHNLDFISEVTLKTPADIKGGILFRNKLTNRIELLETAQVPPENKKDFEDTTRFKDFNINNLWVNLKSLKKIFLNEKLELPLIINPKIVQGQEVLQLESAMGAAISKFEKTKIIRVPRNRFAPVKKSNDLLVKRSDAYILSEKFALVPNPLLQQEPLVYLSKEYDSIFDLENLFLSIPSLISCESLTIEGKFLFDVPTKITKHVHLINKEDVPIKISEYLKKHSIQNIFIESSTKDSIQP
ncbi:MAG: UTP--glucose-1-phosphate uridylyltransferase [Leptonema sp. (in: bacteria)]